LKPKLENNLNRTKKKCHELEWNWHIATSLLFIW